MKTILTLLTALLVVFPVLSDDSGKTGSGTSNSKEVVPIVIIKDVPNDLHFAPPRKLYGTLYIGDCDVTFELPISNYPMWVELTDPENTSAYGSSVFTSPEDCILPYKLEKGNYMIRITDSDNITYNASFTFI